MSDNCKVCHKSGLPILFVRPSAVAHNPELAPDADNAKALQTHAPSVQELKLPALKYSKYVLRALRTTVIAQEGNSRGGYLYIYHEVPSTDLQKIKTNWEIFRVERGGALIPKSSEQYAKKTEAWVCSIGADHPHDVRMYCVPNPLEAKGIWVAYSANEWSAAQLADIANKKQQHMQRIDIAAAVGGSLPPNAFKADTALLEQHIAEFKLENFNHGRKAPIFEFASAAGKASKQVEVMAGRADKSPKTKGKAFVFVVSDPAGLTAELGDIALARHTQGIEYAQSQAQPMNAVQAIAFIKKNVYDSALADITKVQPLTADSLLLADERLPLAQRQLIEPLSFPDGKALPAVPEYPKWVRMGVMRYENFSAFKQTAAQGKSSNQGEEALGFYPHSARWYPMRNHPSDGMVIGLAEEVAAIQSVQQSGKINSLHDREAMKKYVASYKAELQKIEASVANYDSDRALLLESPLLKDYFARHFDPKDPNDPKSAQRPGLIYMNEVFTVVVGTGTPTVGSNKAIEFLLQAKLDSPDGWLLKAMIGNQDDVYGVVTGILGNEANQVLSAEARMDKAYDALRGVLTDDVTGGLLKAKYSWLGPAGSALSAGLGSFVVGAAWGGMAVGLAVAPSAALAGTGAQAIAQALQKPAAKCATKLAAFYAMYAPIMAAAGESLVQKFTPPPKPVVVRAELSLQDAMRVLGTHEAQGKLGENTRKWLEELDKIPAAKQPNTVALEFLSTDKAVKDAAAASNSAASATTAVNSMADGARNVRIASGGAAVLVSADSLGKMYQAAHRWDPAIAAARSALSKGGHIPKSAFVTLGDQGGQLSVFSAFLQYRLLLKGNEKMDKLQALAKTPGLTDIQKEAVQAASTQTQLGLYDNKLGITAGFSEALGVGGRILRVGGASAGWLQAGGSGFAAIAGGAASFMSAAQNFHKAASKKDDGDYGVAAGYTVTGVLYSAAGTTGIVTGVRILGAFILRGEVLEIGFTRAASGAASRFAILRFCKGLSVTGWGLVFTLAAVAVEGGVAYFDRTALEKWVEQCYFGRHAAWRDIKGQSKDECAKQEYEAFELALKKAQADAMAN
jgi:hypothetical protein